MANTNHPSLPQPESHDVIIWRYMNVAQFISMLEFGGLWFANLRRFVDPYEGFHPLEVPENRKMYIEHFRQNGFPTFGDREVDAILDLNKQMVDSSYASCWAESKYESAAFWSFYGTEGKVVAVQSRYERLKAVLDDKIYLGRMTYLPEKEYIFSVGNSLQSLMHKREQFEHEKEVRAMFMEDRPAGVNGHRGICFQHPHDGKFIEVDLGVLIEKVVVRPKAEQWLLQLLDHVVKRYGLGFPVIPSELLTPYRAPSTIS